MKKHVFKALPTYNTTEQIDAEKGIIHGVVLAQKGGYWLPFSKKIVNSCCSTSTFFFCNRKSSVLLAPEYRKIIIYRKKLV
ncbi:hypothetical protein ACILE2_09295 [Capnocytophaga canimorsus]|uniref:hypothetical protein n=1 Tax=Capnocytophaga canimorsus TaxID=28188 RepID=UPI0037CE5CB0